MFHRHLAALGALTTILALAFDPSNQNLIRYYQDNVEVVDRRAYLANATAFDSFGPLVGGSRMFEHHSAVRHLWLTDATQRRT